MDREELRLERVEAMESLSRRLDSTVKDHIDGTIGVEEVLKVVEDLFLEQWTNDFGLFDRVGDAWEWFQKQIMPGLDKITPDSVPRTVADWLGTVIVNGSRAAKSDDGLMWLSRRDNRVRPKHITADGQVVRVGEPFQVGGYDVPFPGAPVGPPELWLNCRCAAVGASMVASVDAYTQHDVIFLEHRRTPKVVSRGARYQPKKSEGRITRRRHATAEEEKTIANGGWVRVNEKGKKPGQPGYMDKKSRVRPQHNSVEEDDMTITADDVAAFAKPDDDTIDVEGVDDDQIEDVPEEDILDEDIDADDEEFDLPDMIPWYGVLAPEGVRSGDGRKFSEGSLTHRDLPLPFRWQESDVGGHDGAVAVGTIDRIWRDGNLYMGSGLLQDSEVADRFIGHVLDGSVRGISVDVDDAEMAADMDENEVEFSKGRVCAATAVMIPAFAEAFIGLGEYMGESGSEEEFKDYDTEQRKRAADKGNALPDGSYPINDCEDLHNAIQAIGRAKDPDKVKAHIRKRKKALGCEDIELPDTWAIDDELSMIASGDEEFKRGAGWVTHPKETRRLHAYWTKGKGAAKIRWGTPGDFRRLRRQLRKYISPAYLNRTTAQWHRDALGYWPGECGKPGNPKCGEKRGALGGEAVHLVASASRELPYEWFADPVLDGPTPMTVEGDRIYGHLALWDTCHVGLKGICTTPPKSGQHYAYFQTGAVRTDQGLVPVGQLTMNTGHADLSANPAATIAHYDHTGTAVADVCVGEDEYGIWYAGAIRSGADVDTLLAGAISGDWRAIGGQLEMVAALVVNVPGFPIPRTGIAASGGVQTALVGEPPLFSNRWGAPVEAVTEGFDLDALAAALEERQDRRDRAAWLAGEMREQRVAALKAKFE